MAGELEIRPGTSDDTDEILRLVKTSLGEGQVPRHVDYWTWKHEDNPFGGSPSLLAISADDGVVGLRVFMRWKWQGGGKSWDAVRAVDTATHPDWRGQGVFTRLTLTLLERMESEGVSFVFNTPNDKSRPGYLKMGWEDVGRVSLWIRPIRLGALRVAAFDSTGTAPDEGDEEPGPTEAPGFPASEVLRHPALSAFLDSLPNPGKRFSTPRTTEYLRWRYSEIPDLAYRAILDLNGSRGALVIFRVRRRGRLRELRLCEVLVSPDPVSRGVARDLLRFLIAESRAEYAAVMAPVGSSGVRVFPTNGFIPAPRCGPVMTVRPLNDVTGLDPLRRSDWHLSIGDLELF